MDEFENSLSLQRSSFSEKKRRIRQDLYLHEAKTFPEGGERLEETSAYMKTRFPISRKKRFEETF